MKLFANVPEGEVLNVIKNKLKDDSSLEEHSTLNADAIIQLLKVCSNTSYLTNFINKKMVQQWVTLHHQYLATYTWNFLNK